MNTPGFTAENSLAPYASFVSTRSKRNTNTGAEVAPALLSNNQLHCEELCGDDDLCLDSCLNDMGIGSWGLRCVPKCAPCITTGSGKRYRFCLDGRCMGHVVAC
jgi:hypothetical protein